ncbi:Hypothetical predicted protein [Mytilus galloprovincialis]|uniref:AIG1-type G domain-containing protein n=1 Tax=Mytilus galloprovincialis TaxID=29158 RepID=A0A8B6HAH2_MYTGA|nr:Hypothetical predicted protein [Mytilus galloprovincialis]
MVRAVNIAFVLIGTQGSGKSATGNSIVGETYFKSMPGTDPLTKTVKEVTMQWQNRNITIIDTPPLSQEFEVAKITNHMRSRKYTYIKYGFVISIGRPLKIELLLLETIFRDLDQNKEDLVMIFSRYDDLDSDNPFESWLLNCPILDAFIKKTNIKCFYFANKNGNTLIKDQVNDLMETIIGISNDVEHNESQKQVDRSLKVNTWVNEVKHNESQANEKHLTNAKTTQTVKHDEMLADVESKPKIYVSCELLEEYFGKCGVLFYNEMLKNGL